VSTISTGIGLVSGLPIQDLVDSLIAVQRRPITQLSAQFETLGAERAAFLQISAQLLTIQNAAARFTSSTSFTQSKATSSNTSAIVASASPGSALGQFTFTVRNLASSHQVISAGVASKDTSPVGAGTLTIETAHGILNNSTPLDLLRGGEGITRGKILITDRAGGFVQLDLTSAATIDDVIGLINQQSAAKVKAHVEGDHLVLTDQTGLLSGTLSVAEVSGGQTASQLGILGASGTGVITGADLVAVSPTTRLAELNDGNGVRSLKSQDDFAVSLADGTTLNYSLSDRIAEQTPLAVLNRGAGVPAGSIRISTKAGDVVDVDLSGAVTLGDVKAAIESAVSGVLVTLSGSKILINDSSTGQQETKVEEVGGGTTAAALGLLKPAASGAIIGSDIYFVETVDDVLRIINHHVDNGGKLTASIAPDGRGLRLTDNTAGAGTLQVTALNGSGAAEDLGLLGGSVGGVLDSRRLLAGLNTVLLRSLNGGSGIGAGTIQLTDRSGATAAVDLSGAATLSEVIAAINGAGTAITATITGSGLGIELIDSSGGTGNLVIADLTGTAAADLGIAVSIASQNVVNRNLQRQYISTATLLDDLKVGQGFQRGLFRMTDSQGKTAVVDLTQGNEKTMQDVIDEINSRGIGVVARINDSGDGLLLEDTAGGAGALTVAEEGSTTAKSLGILGSVASGQSILDGSFETRIDVSASDSLQNVLDKINAAGSAASAVILNDGSAGRPYRLSLTSSKTGRLGELAVDAGTTSLAFSTLAHGRDATVIFGDPTAASPLVFSSSTNSISTAVEGVRLDLVGTSDAPVTISVTRDVESLVGDISSFVTAYNAVIGTLDDLTHFAPETEQRGVLTSDATARRVRDRLISLATSTLAGLTSKFKAPSQIGVTLAAGSQLHFDETAFRNALQSDPEAVATFFTDETAGFGQFVKKQIDLLTKADTGLLSLEDESIQASQDLLQDRISQMELLLDRQRERLLAQFAATEGIIAQLQSQQAALSSISLLPV